MQKVCLLCISDILWPEMLMASVAQEASTAIFEPIARLRMFWTELVVQCSSQYNLRNVRISQASLHGAQNGRKMG